MMFFGIGAFVAGLLWLIVLAFRKHWLWGLLSILWIAPVPFVFGIVHYGRAKKPFLWYTGGLAAWTAAIIWGIYGLD
jgi:hypothetical protein